MSDEKTRIIPRKQEATPARLVGDQIVFLCPNGDRISVPAKLAGKRGQCSKCKVAVVIPTVGGGRPAAQPSPVAPPVEEPEAPAEESPVEAADSQQPAAEEPPLAPPPAEPSFEPPIPAAGPAAEGSWNFFDESAGAADASHVGLDMNGGSSIAEAWQPPADVPGDQREHPAARLVARLWAERGHGGIIELHLAGGSVILPEWYEVNWSRGAYGLFASQAVDGTVTLSAVAWDTIEKIVVRQVDGLPDGMFE